MLRGEREEEMRKGRGDGDGEGDGEGGRSDAEGTEVENLTGREGEGEGGQMGSELRRREAGLSQSSASTEDEWEKVSGK
ncbi:hypothetical protein E4U36_001648 [Claviceps purpurea]|nr:hypothetical protein E4U36_001648 [Claviceps purpurea]